jgi:hypothetical protein
MKIVNLKTITSGAKVAAGFAAGSLVTKAAGQSGVIGVLIPFIGAGLTAAMMGKKGSEIAIGMASYGVVNGVRHFAPGIASQVGLAGIGGGVGYLPARASTAVNSVAGNMRYADSFVTN